MITDQEFQKFRAELDAANAENRELRRAVVTLCDTYSANRAEKLKVKAYRSIAANGEPFSTDAVLAALGQLDQRERGADETADLKARAGLLEAASRPGEPLTDKSGPTVQGHVISAIAKIKRELEQRLMGGKS